MACGRTACIGIYPGSTGLQLQQKTKDPSFVLAGQLLYLSVRHHRSVLMRQQVLNLARREGQVGGYQSESLTVDDPRADDWNLDRISA